MAKTVGEMLAAIFGPVEMMDWQEMRDYAAVQNRKTGSRMSYHELAEHYRDWLAPKILCAPGSGLTRRTLTGGLQVIEGRSGQVLSTRGWVDPPTETSKTCQYCRSSVKPELCQCPNCGAGV